MEIKSIKKQSKLPLKNQSGYVALMATVTISISLLALTATISSNVMSTRFGSFDAERKRISLGLAESCVNSALLKVAKNYNYSGSENFTVQFNNAQQNCKINSITYESENSNSQKPATIVAESGFQGAFSKIKVKALVKNPNKPNSPAIPNFEIISWQEEF